MFVDMPKAIIGGNGEHYEETVLWTNSSPTTSMGSSNITLNDSVINYDYIRVEFRKTISDAGYLTSLIVKPSDLINSKNDANYFFVQTSQYRIGSANATTRKINVDSSAPNVMIIGAPSNNNYIIPTRVVGIKRVSSVDKGTLLWENDPSLPAITTNIQLSDSVDNYSKIKILYYPFGTRGTHTIRDEEMCELIIPSILIADNSNWERVGYWTSLSTSYSAGGYIYCPVANDRTILAPIGAASASAYGIMKVKAIYGIK